MPCADGKPANLLLHACCGPCSLEPVRLLRERGIEPHIFFSNANIAPAEEYDLRLATLRAWADDVRVQVTEDVRDADGWNERVGIFGACAEGEQRRARCRACYRMRLEATAAHAAACGFDAIGTTLSVSPYQYTDIIREEVERAAATFGLHPFFEDYSPHYARATERSRREGMYRQNYCGCAFSAAEAKREREERRQAREAERARRAAARAPEEAARAAKRAARAAYDEKRAHQRAVLKQLRAEARSSAHDAAGKRVTAEEHTR